MADVESLELLIEGNASGAKKSLDTLIDTLKELERVTSGGCGLSAITKETDKLKNVNIGLSSANRSSSKSFANLATRVAAAGLALKKGASIVSSWIKESSDYTENMNLFTVSMGANAKTAEEYVKTVGDAMDYANLVSEAMGIDPSEWMRSQGVLMTLATGFGVAGDRAALMSKQLTQLGYDISSYYNLPVEEAMQKLKSGFAGELEPLRSLGYDLSQAKLEAIALSLGIDKAVSSMTQAEKAELRYYAIMTQVKQVQGDMARTLTDPANQMRVFNAQITMTARSLGNLFIPLLNAVLPYAIAVTKVIRMLADAVASLFNIEIPEVDLSGASNIGNNNADGFKEANKEVTKMKRTLLGIDELNVLSDTSSAGGSGIGGGSFDFDLPTYDFIGEAANNRVDEIVNSMKEWLGITGEITNWADLLDTRLGFILGTVGAIGVAFGTWKIGGTIVTAVGAIKTSIASVSGWLAATKASVLATTGVSLGAIAGVVAAVAAVVAGLTLVYLKNEDVKKSVDNAVASIGTALVPLFEFMTGTVIPNLKSAWDELLVILKPLGDWIAMVFTSVWEDMLIPALEWIGSTLVPNLTTTFTNLWNNVLVPLGTFIGSVLSPVISILGDVLTWLWQYVVVPVADFVGCVFATAWEGIAKIWNESVIPRINKVISVFQFLWNHVLKPLVDFLWGVWGPVIKTAFEFIGEHIRTIKEIFSGLIKFVTGIFTRDWDYAWSGVVQLFGGIFANIANQVKTPFNLALTYIESFINKIIDGWNGLKKQLNKLSFDIPDWLGGGKFGLDLAMSQKITLPRFADGGYPTTGQMFIANEAGPELVGTIGNRSAVVNNDQIVSAVSKGVYQAVVQAMGQSGNQTVEAKVNDKVLFEVVVNRNRQETMRMGYSPLLGGV